MNKWADKHAYDNLVAHKLCKWSTSPFALLYSNSKSSKVSNSIVITIFSRVWDRLDYCLNLELFPLETVALGQSF